ncbi:hypothetical protein MBLNU459_g7667t1 [Dothideomycetes sp. NU459]
MSSSKLIADGLWHCLCPSYTPVALAYGRTSLVRRRRPAPRCLSAKTVVRRQLSSQPARPEPQSQSDRCEERDVALYSPEALPEPPSQLRQSLARAPTIEAWAPIGNDNKRPPKPAIDTKRRTRGAARLVTVEDEATPTLYELARAAALRGEIDEVKRIVEHLVRDRKETPNLRLYSALILSNVDPDRGAAWRVASLLDEMHAEGLTMDIGLCHDVLKVLSVHVDYLLRADVLDYMRQRWLDLSDEGQHDVAAALIREGQLELAVDKLEEMKHNAIDIRPWLSDMAVYALIESGEFDDALRLLEDRVAPQNADISGSLWSHFLDAASSAFHHPATSYCWNSQVNPGYLNPPSGVCLNVLTTAARSGDASLATDAFHVLGKRSTAFKSIHYEQLLNTYLATSPPDLRAALTVLTIMTAVKLEPDPTSTRSLNEYLGNNPHACSEAFDILTSLHDAGRTVPLAALNLLIEVHAQHRELDKAIGVYKALHTFERFPVPQTSAPAPPRKPFANLETFNHLIRACHRVPGGALHTALFLISEMLALGITPDVDTYDRLVRVCIEARNLDLAWQYFNEMDSLGFVPRVVQASNLAQELATVGDERCWDVLQRMQDHGKRVDLAKSAVERLWTSSSRERRGRGTVGADRLSDS